jgi:hypothetical protein
MKKLLLIATALIFSLSAQAQEFATKADAEKVCAGRSVALPNGKFNCPAYANTGEQATSDCKNIVGSKNPVSGTLTDGTDGTPARDGSVVR